MLINILLLEDDLLFAETLIDLLEDNDFTVTHAPNGQKALNLTFQSNFDLYLLDINVPLINGLTLLKELREADDKTPAIFLTSHKDKSILKDAFTYGVDDYIQKPFDTDELILRIKALLRRCAPTEHKTLGSLSHDSIHKTISYNSKELELSQKEYLLLLLLMTHIDKTVPKELIIDYVWSSSQGGSAGAIRVYINRLKQLVPELLIENIRGIGYKLVS